MNNNELSKLILKLVGLPIWDIIVGPPGVHIQFGKKLVDIPSVLNSGEISLWCECNARIFRNRVGGETILDSLYPQEEDEVSVYKKYFEDKIVKDTFIREKDQSLHVLVEGNIIFTAYPWTRESEKCWTIFDRHCAKTKSITVYSNDIVTEG